MLPKYVKRVRSKGNDYLYFDTGKLVEGKKVYVRLPGLREPGFGGSYAALLGHRHRKAPSEVLRVPAAIKLYQKNPDYEKLAPSTRKSYEIYLRRFESMMPTAPIAEITRGDIRKLVDSLSATPGAANAFLWSVGALYAWAKKYEHVKDNPCEGISAPKGGEHEPWPEHILRAALASDDRNVRLLTHLLYFTAQRLGDVLNMRWDSISGQTIAVLQQKTNKYLTIPLHNDLKAELEQTPRTSEFIYASPTGKAVHQDTARKALKAFTASQNTPCVPHGLRKNAVITLLEVGCSMGETAAISGQTLRLVEYYAKGRDQTKLAGAAMKRWEGVSAADSTRNGGKHKP